MATSQFTFYSSYDAGAPLLTGNTGSLVGVLTACLVTGYGSQTATGWSMDYTSSTMSGSTFRPPSGSRFYLNVDDSAPITAMEARICGYETMTAFDTGSGRFPFSGSVNSKAGYFTVKKSNTLNPISDASSIRQWILAADAYTAYMWIASDSTSTLNAGGNVYDQGFWFGDIYSFKGSSDAYRGFIVGRIEENSTANCPWDLQASSLGPASIIASLSPVAGHYLCRSHNGKPGCVQFAKFSDTGRMYASLLYGFNGYPNSPNKALLLSPIYIEECDTTSQVRISHAAGINLRGRMRGLYGIHHPSDYFFDGQLIEGTNNYAGKVFRIIKSGGNFSSTNYGGKSYIAVETSATVETN